MFVSNPLKEIQKKIYSYKPDIIGFSIRNLDSQVMALKDNPLPEIKTYIQFARQKGIITVLGGTAFSTLPKEMLEYMEADYGIVGQGEKSFSLFLKALVNKKDYHNISGLVYRKNDKILVNKNIIEGFAGKKADWSAIDFKKYRKTYWAGCMLVKTGCPYSCIYCETHKAMGVKFLFRPFEEILDDMLSMQKLHNLKSFFILDPCFNTPADKAKEFLIKLINSKIKVHIITVFVPIKNTVDNEMLILYKKAGGIISVLSPDTLSQVMLKNYKKPFDLDSITQTAELLKKHKIPFIVDLIFNGPGENHNTIKEVVNYAKKMSHAMLHYTFGMRILPDTELYNIAFKEGIVNSPSELLFPKYYNSKDVDLKWAKKYLESSLRFQTLRVPKLLPFAIKSLMGRYLNIY